MRILIAEDDPATRFMLEDTVSDWDYDVVTAVDGRKAYDILSGQDAPQLALLDWMMPGMAGPEICLKVRQTDGLPFIYMIILTGKSEKNDLTVALEAGADDFLSKPVDNDELKSRLTVGVRSVEYERVLIEKNKQLDTYAVQMEELAEERARQLVHAERLATLGTLTAGVAHQMASPLLAISGNLDLLGLDFEAALPCIRDVIAAGAKDEEYLNLLVQETPQRLNDIKTSVARLSQFLQQLRGFSRKEQEWTDSCEVNQCIESALSIAATRLQGGVIVERHFGSKLPPIYANPQEIEQVFLNLCVNAADAMASNGGGTLRIESQCAEGGLVVTIEDTGCGIPEDKLETIWMPFFTTKDVDKGLGLGLSISQGIVANHKGTIRAENKPEGGARFIVELPISAAPPP